MSTTRTEPSRIALLTTHFPPKRGGVETSNLQYLNTAARLDDIHIDVITYQERGVAPLALGPLDEHIHYVRVPQRVFKFFLSPESIARIDAAGFGKKAIYLLCHLAYMAKGILKHRRIIKEADLILANGALVEGLPAGLASVLFRRRLVLRWRTDISGFIINPLVRSIVKGLFRRASQIHVNGSNMVAEIAEQLGIARNKIHVRRNGVDLAVCRQADRQEARRALELDDAAFILLFACALDETSSADYALELIDRLMSDAPDIQAVFIGTGPLLPELTRIREKHPGRIRHIGQLVEPAVLNQYVNASSLVMAKADVCYPSRLAIEAVACGTPVAIPMRPTSAVTGRRRIESLTLDVPNTFFHILPPDPAKGARHILDNRGPIEAASAPDTQDAMRQYVEEHFDYTRLLSEELRAMPQR